MNIDMAKKLPAGMMIDDEGYVRLKNEDAEYLAEQYYFELTNLEDEDQPSSTKEAKKGLSKVWIGRALRLGKAMQLLDSDATDDISQKRKAELVIKHYRELG